MVRRPKIIALYSPANGSGKSTAAAYLHDVLSADRISFAHDLAGIVRTLVAKKTGGTWTNKDAPIPGFASRATPRALMIAIGQAARQVDPDIWVDITRERIKYSLQRGRSVVVDDLRMPNEYEMLEHMGAVMVRITRPSRPVAPAETEARLEGYHWDFKITNDARDIPGFHDILAGVIVSAWKERQ